MGRISWRLPATRPYASGMCSKGMCLLHILVLLFNYLFNYLYFVLLFQTSYLFILNLYLIYVSFCFVCADCAQTHPAVRSMEAAAWTRAKSIFDNINRCLSHPRTHACSQCKRTRCHFAQTYSAVCVSLRVTSLHVIALPVSVQSRLFHLFVFLLLLFSFEEPISSQVIAFLFTLSFLYVS